MVPPFNSVLTVQRNPAEKDVGFITRLRSVVTNHEVFSDATLKNTARSLIAVFFDGNSLQPSAFGIDKCNKYIHAGDRKRHLIVHSSPSSAEYVAVFR